MKAVAESAQQLAEAAAAKKCWRCGCLHNSLTAIESAFPNGSAHAELKTVLSTAQERLVPVKYDCLGCEVCYPALAINALNHAGHSVEPDECANEPVEERAGWPPLPGAYTVLRYQAPVAVCTLTDEVLSEQVAREADEAIAIVGSVQTENLGIERLIANILANPHIRFLILCGADTQKAVGHLPGQSLVALSRSGISDRKRIVGAQGRRPVIRNLDVGAVEHFRRNVEVVDLIGETDSSVILDKAAECAVRSPGPAQALNPEKMVRPGPGHLPERMVSDPAGYFVVYVDQRRQLLSLEHYQNNGVLDTVIEGRTAAELYCPAVERELLSRLDHAAYLGRELARAERSLRTDEPYVQDAAPERQRPDATTSCGCAASCGE
jgi:tetrahydromethanopterin S-methyltransferase subunit A